MRSMLGSLEAIETRTILVLYRPALGRDVPRHGSPAWRPVGVFEPAGPGLVACAAFHGGRSNESQRSGTCRRRHGRQGKGILAADESSRHHQEALRFDQPRVHRREPPRPTATCCSRRRAPPSASAASSSTTRPCARRRADGVPFPEYLAKLGMIPGIKVDTGAKPLAGFPGETITEGLDGLRERLTEYYKLGARFAKWRAVIDIGAGIPTLHAPSAPTPTRWRATRRCARNRHRADRRTRGADGRRPHARALRGGDRRRAGRGLPRAAVARACISKASVLKPNMVISGKKMPNRASPAEVAEATMRCLKRQVPAAVPGIAFLSGGQRLRKPRCTCR